MTHISLDSQEEPIKRFVLSLPSDPNGWILELNGRAVARIMPVYADENTQPNGAREWTGEMNARRCELIDKEIAGTLLAEEAEELALLQRAMLHYRRRVAPLPLEDARRLHQELLAKARHSASDE